MNHEVIYILNHHNIWYDGNMTLLTTNKTLIISNRITYVRACSMHVCVCVCFVCVCVCVCVCQRSSNSRGEKPLRKWGGKRSLESSLIIWEARGGETPSVVGMLYQEPTLSLALSLLIVVSGESLPTTTTRYCLLAASSFPPLSFLHHARWNSPWGVISILLSFILMTLPSIWAICHLYLQMTPSASN